MKTNKHLWSYRVQLFLELETFQTNTVEKIKHMFYIEQYFFRKLCRLWDNMEKYCTDGQGTDGDMAHAHCLMVT